MLCIRQNQTKVVVRYGLCQMVSCAVIIYKRMQRGKQEQTVKCTETKTIMINNAEGSRERYRKPNEKLGAKGISEVRRERESVWNKVKPKYSQHLKSEMLSSTYSTRIVTDFSSDSSVQDRQHDTHRILNSIENLNEFSPVRSSINPALISSFKISPWIRIICSNVWNHQIRIWQFNTKQMSPAFKFNFQFSFFTTIWLKLILYTTPILFEIVKYSHATVIVSST